jgi:hypothetical protein
MNKSRISIKILKVIQAIISKFPLYLDFIWLGSFQKERINFKKQITLAYFLSKILLMHRAMDQWATVIRKMYNLYNLQLRGVVVDLSGLRDRGPGFKTRSRPLTFMKADTNFRTLHVVGFSCTNEFYRIPSCKRR